MLKNILGNKFFDHFCHRVAENRDFIFYISTLGFAFKINKHNGMRFLIMRDNANRVKINGGNFSLPKLIYSTIYDKIKIEKLIFIDNDKKNCNIENLAAIPSGMPSTGIYVKDKHTGFCKRLTTTEYANLFNALEKKSRILIEEYKPHYTKIETRRFAIFEKFKGYQQEVAVINFNRKVGKDFEELKTA